MIKKLRVLALLLCMASFGAVAETSEYDLSQDSLNALNDSLSETFGALEDRKLLSEQIKAGMVESLEEARIKYWRESIRLRQYFEPTLYNFDKPPRLSLEGNKLVLTYPGGNEKLGARVKVKMEYNKNGLPTADAYITARLSDMQIKVSSEIDVDEYGRVIFTSSPVLSVSNPRIELEGGSMFTDLLLSIVNPIIKEAVHSYLQGYHHSKAETFLATASLVGLATGLPVGLPEEYQSDGVIEDFNEGYQWLEGFEFEVIGAERELPVTAVIPNIEEIAINIDDKIDSVHMQYGSLLSMFSSTPSYKTWQEKYATPLTDSQKKALSRSAVSDERKLQSSGDSAMFTGFHLGSMAHRYAVRNDNESHRLLNDALTSVERLYALNNDSGLLARIATPESSILGPLIKERIGSGEHIMMNTLNGEKWIGRQDDGISRDMYVGVLFGLTSVYRMVDDKDLRLRAKRLIEMTADYLIDNTWVITEDRNTTDSTLEMKGTPTFWANAGYQKATILAVAAHVIPEKYGNQYEEAKKLLNSSWLNAVANVADPTIKYYKNNLFYTTLYTYLLVANNDEERDAILRAARIMDYYIGHHNNAFFTAVRGVYDERRPHWQREQAWEMLKEYLKRGHQNRYLGDDADMKEEVDKLEEYFVPELGEKLLLPSEPVPIAQRGFNQFLWQNSPFNFASTPANDARLEKLAVDTERLLRGHRQGSDVEQPGIDFSLVYWMLRYQESDNVYLEPLPSNLRAAKNPFDLTHPKIELANEGEVKEGWSEQAACVAPSNHFITGFGGRIQDGLVTTLHLEVRENKTDGSLGPRKVHKCGSEPDVDPEKFVSLPDNYVMTGFGGHVKSNNFIGLTIYGKKLDSMNATLTLGTKAVAGTTGLEMSFQSQSSTTVLRGLGLRVYESNIRGYVGYTQEIKEFPVY